MLSEQAPDCVCGKHNFKAGGGSFGGRIATTSFTCPDCNRSIWIIEDGRQPVALIDTHSDILAGLSMENYVNDILLPSRDAAPLNPSPYPPCLPDNITAFQRGAKDGLWYKVDHSVSQSLPLPQDPSKKKHDDFWRALITKTGLKTPVKEVKNRYYDDRRNVEPWYEFKIDQDTTVVFGYRKRVISIQVSRWLDYKSPITIPFKNIEEVAKKDNVTFSNDVDGRRQILEVHAWGQEKFVEYFKCVMNELGHDLDQR